MTTSSAAPTPGCDGENVARWVQDLAAEYAYEAVEFELVDLADELLARARALAPLHTPITTVS